jgi:hypothetical protein
MTAPPYYRRISLVKAHFVAAQTGFGVPAGYTHLPMPWRFACSYDRDRLDSGACRRYSPVRQTRLGYWFASHAWERLDHTFEADTR